MFFLSSSPLYFPARSPSQQPSPKTFRGFSPAAGEPPPASTRWPCSGRSRTLRSNQRIHPGITVDELDANPPRGLHVFAVLAQTVGAERRRGEHVDGEHRPTGRMNVVGIHDDVPNNQAATGIDGAVDSREQFAILLTGILMCDSAEPGAVGP